TTGARAIGRVAVHSSRPDWRSAQVMPSDGGRPEEIIGAAVSIGAATTSTSTVRSTSTTAATTGSITSITDTVSGTTIRTSPTNSTRETTSATARRTAWISVATMVKPRFDRAAQEIGRARAEAACIVQVAAIVQVSVPATVRAAAIVQVPVPATDRAAAI